MASQIEVQQVARSNDDHRRYTIKLEYSAYMPRQQQYFAFYSHGFIYISLLAGSQKSFLKQKYLKISKNKGFIGGNDFVILS